MGILGDIADGLVDGATDIISQGADEASKALFTGNGYAPDQSMAPEAPPDMQTAVESQYDYNQAYDQYAASQQAEVVMDTAPAQDMTPNEPSQSYDAMLDAAAAQMPSQGNDMDLGR